MILAVLSGFLVALLLSFFGRFFRGKLSFLLGLLPLCIFNYFLYFFPAISAGKTLRFTYKWIPSMGISLDFRVDGLSMLFALLITGIGAFVFFYAAAYLKGHRYLDRFYGYLSLFMAAMLGLVLADNLLLLFIFWELTSISSFFLIGFNNENADSRKSALMALAITGGGGFFLLAGFVLLGHISDTYSIRAMLFSSEALKAHPAYGLALLFVFLGAFTKSAIFPFHFWLPGAMKAPTPVSAYLHSATMVKAGIYLLARFNPVLGNHPFWNVPLLLFGGFTMVYAAFHAIYRTDLKGILAYSTIAALGLCTFLLGIGSEYAIKALAVFILVHAMYKACLFLITGVIDHETGTRDILRLGGLRKLFPALSLAGLLAALSSAGIPLTFGFIAKDLTYEATLHTPGYLPWILTTVTLIANVCLSYAGYQAGIRPFRGELPPELNKPYYPSVLLWLPPLLLGIAGVVTGIVPFMPDDLLLRHTAHAINGPVLDVPLKLWHGFTTVLWLSAGTIVSGIALYLLFRPSVLRLEKFNGTSVFSPQHLLEWLAVRVRRFALQYTRLLHNGYLRSYILIIIVSMVCLIGYKFFTSIDLKVNTSNFTEIRLYEFVVFGIMVVAIVKTVFTSSRLTAIVSMSILGYAICLMFVFYGAPDLAMTQFTIDTLTVVLFVLVLFRLPQFLNISNPGIQLRDGIVSLSFGALISLITLQALISPANKEISRYYADNAYLLAKGKNVVNVILVDFRGFDTMVEIIVLTIAALGVYSLLKLNVKATDKE